MPGQPIRCVAPWSHDRGNGRRLGASNEAGKGAAIANAEQGKAVDDQSLEDWEQLFDYAEYYREEGDSIKSPAPKTQDLVPPGLSTQLSGKEPKDSLLNSESPSIHHQRTTMAHDRMLNGVPDHYFASYAQFPPPSTSGLAAIPGGEVLGNGGLGAPSPERFRTDTFKPDALGSGLPNASAVRSVVPARSLREVLQRKSREVKLVKR